MKHRVQKILSNNGFCSRRKAEELIIKGRVSVNGQPITIGDKAEEDDAITVDGREVQKHRKIYLMLNKPKGCVTALKDPSLKTIAEYIPVRERVFPIGRLDFNTTGLLLLTNDGDFANKIMHPRYEIKKTYVAAINKPIMKKHISILEQGVPLEDGMTRPAHVRLISPTTIEITIHEGRNRLVRRMLEHLGYRTFKLKRTQIGPLKLGKLASGVCERFYPSKFK